MPGSGRLGEEQLGQSTTLERQGHRGGDLEREWTQIRAQAHAELSEQRLCRRDRRTEHGKLRDRMCWGSTQEVGKMRQRSLAPDSAEQRKW